jgi:hypothetical protein
MDLQKDVLIEIEGLFQFVVMLQIFFISIMDLLFKMTTDTSNQVIKVQLEYGALIAVFLSSYVLFKIFGKRFSQKILNISKWLLISIIISLIPLVFIIGIIVYKTVIHSIFINIIFMLSMWALILIPISVFLLFFSNIIYLLYKEPLIEITRFIKKKLTDIKNK